LAGVTLGVNMGNINKTNVGIASVAGMLLVVCGWAFDVGGKDKEVTQNSSAIKEHIDDDSAHDTKLILYKIEHVRTEQMVIKADLKEILKEVRK